MKPPSPIGPRVELTVHLETRAHGAKRIRTGPKPKTPPREKLPRLTRLLALAHRWDRLLQDGTFSSRAQIARLMGISRARVTQIMDLLYLAPEIQEDIFNSSSTCTLAERAVRSIAGHVIWKHQRDLFPRSIDNSSGE